MFRFEQYLWLHALWVLIPVVGMVFYFLKWRSKKSTLFADPNLLDVLRPAPGKNRTFFKFFCWFAGFIFLVVAIANPQYGTRQETVRVKGSEVMVCLDISPSMLATDFQPNRLEAAKKELTRLLARLKGHKVGLIVFSGQSFVQLPLTSDHQTARLFMNPVSVDMMSSRGTAIGSAIDLAVKSFSNSGAGKTIVLITDGENHEDDALESAAKASAAGIKVHCIGVGSLSGVPIPSPESGGFLKDETGNTVISRLNPDLLSTIASSGSGAFITATQGDFGIEQVADLVSSQKQVEQESKRFTDFESHFNIFLLFALFFFLLESIVSEKKSGLWKKWSNQ